MPALEPLNAPIPLDELAYDIGSLNLIQNVDKIIARAVRKEDGTLESWDLSSLGLEALPESLGQHAMKISGNLDLSRNFLKEVNRSRSTPGGTC